MLKRSRYAHYLNPETQCLADSGFQGIAKIHSNSQVSQRRWKGKPLSLEQKASNKAIAKKRVTAEHLIRRLKVFRIFKETYRHRRRRFSLRLHLIAALYNADLTFA